MDYKELAHWIGIIICAGMALFQLILALGAPFGKFAWGGAHKRLPRNLRIGSLISSILFLIAILTLLEKSNIYISINNSIFTNVLSWFFTILFGVSTILNIISRSKWEKIIMIPVASILFIIFLLLVI